MNAAIRKRHKLDRLRAAAREPNEVCRKDRKDGLRVDRRLESPAQKMALHAGPLIAAPDARMSILAVGMLTRPHTLTQTPQNTVKSYLQTGRAIRFCSSPCGAGLSHMAEHGEEELIVPSCTFDFAFDGALCGVAAQDVECEFPE